MKKALTNDQVAALLAWYNRNKDTNWGSWDENYPDLPTSATYDSWDDGMIRVKLDHAVTYQGEEFRFVTNQRGHIPGMKEGDNRVSFVTLRDLHERAIDPAGYAARQAAETEKCRAEYARWKERDASIEERLRNAPIELRDNVRALLAMHGVAGKKEERRALNDAVNAGGYELVKDLLAPGDTFYLTTALRGLRNYRALFEPLT